KYYIQKMQIPSETRNTGVHLKSLNPSETLALFLHNRGAAQADRGRLKEAMEDFTESLFLNPHYADSYLDRGQIPIDLGQYDRAKEDLRQAERIDPRYSGAPRNVEYTKQLRKALK